ncbi:ABC transporter substrate-binding protein [Saliphagus sp. GCM10025308]
MSREAATRRGLTRREAIAYSGTVLGGSVLSGCLAEEGNGDGGSSTSTGSGTEGDPDGEATRSEGESYTATLAPVGEVTFDAVPESVFTVFPWYADMAVALGHGDSINSLWWAEEFDSIMQYFTADLEGVSVSWADLEGQYGANEERLYELDSDLHLVDPAWLSTQDGWDRDAVDRIADTVAPWFGNQYSNLHQTPPEAWAADYEYYTLWELFEQVAAVYRERARYEALASVHADLLARIERDRPTKADRPTVGYLQLPTDLSAVSVLRLNAAGYYNAHTRPLGATDAFADLEITGEFAAVDFETLLEADPDVLLVLWGMTSSVDLEALRANLEDHSIGGHLSAVQEGRVYTQGTRFQGPLMNLFQLEMTAKQLYPEQFGEWPGYEDGDSYPDFDADEQLFDRQRVSTIVTEGSDA